MASDEPKIVFDEDKDKENCIKELILFYNNELKKNNSDISFLDGLISALVILSTNSDDKIEGEDKDKIKNEIINDIKKIYKTKIT